MSKSLTNALSFGISLSRQEMKKISGGSVSCTTLDGAGNVYSLSCPPSYSVTACRQANRQMCGYNCTYTMCSGHAQE